MGKNLLRKFNFLITIFFLALMLGPLNQAKAATPMPHFNLKTAMDGAAFDSDTMRGKVLLVTFFATWCPPCMQEVSSLIKLQQEFGSKGFSVIGISVDQGGTGPVKKVIEKTGINYTVLMADSKVTNDFGGVVGIPTSFLINQQGNVIKNYPGYVGHTVFEEDIKKLLP